MCPSPGHLGASHATPASPQQASTRPAIVGSLDGAVWSRLRVELFLQNYDVPQKAEHVPFSYANA